MENKKLAKSIYNNTPENLRVTMPISKTCILRPLQIIGLTMEKEMVLQNHRWKQ